jgi:DNA-binding transcriptional LysR family regulator
MSDRLLNMSVFASVVDAKSFSAAAQKLDISKSLVSRRVSALERSLGVKLLNRTTRRLSVTEVGQVVYEHCARIVEEADFAERDVTHLQSEPSGRVSLTANSSFAVRHLLPCLPEFHQRYPKITVRLSCSNRFVDLADEGFDLGIRGTAHPPASNLVARPLAPTRLVLCGSPDYLRRHGAPRRLEDIRKHACMVIPSVAPKGIWFFRRAGRRYPVKVSGMLELDDMEAVWSAVIAGLGLGLISSDVAGADIRRGALVPLLRQYRPDYKSEVYLVYLPNRYLSSKVRALIDFLLARFGPTPYWEEGW